VAYRVHVKTLALLDETVEGVDDVVHGEVRWRAGSPPSGWAEAEVAGFHSGIRSRDHHVARLLGAPALPRIRFELGRLEGFRAERPSGKAVAVGRLTANGHGVDVRVPLSYTREGDRLRIEGEAPLRFTDFGITPPTLGIVMKQVPDALTIHVKLLAKRS
jgi:hypothetical protein